MALEERISRLEGAYEQVDRRLDDLNQSINALRTEMNSRLNNTYVLIGASWVTVVGAVIGLYFK
ncbi:MAG: hypothetical protein J4F46_09800 [Dehalococcoidia bacterium]|nr:hypothetical protein [Dehalococcoidia bacterium]